MDSDLRRYLMQETALFLLLSYVIFLGGSFNGLVLYELNLLNGILIVTLGSLWFGWRRFHRSPFPASALDIAWLAFILATSIATIFSADPRRSLMYLVQLSVAVLFFYLTLDLLRSGVPWELFVKVLLLIALIPMFFGMLELFRWFGAWWAIEGVSDFLPRVTIRVRSFLGHPNFAAAFFYLLTPLALARCIEQKGRWKRAALLIWSIIALLLLFFTSSRGGWLAMAAGIGVWVVLTMLDKPTLFQSLIAPFKRRKWIVAPLILVLVLSGFAGWALVDYQSQHPTHGSGIGSRSGIWDVGMDMFRNDPLFGHGPFTYGTQYLRPAANSIPPGLILTHAHNLYLNIAAEAGLLGLSALLLLGYVTIRQAWIVWHHLEAENRSQLNGVLAGLAALSVHSFFDTPVTMPALALLAMLMLSRLNTFSEKQAGRRYTFIGNSMLLMVWIALSVGMIWHLRAYRLYHAGIQASHAQDWRQAGNYFQESLELDSRLALGWFQYAFATGQEALSAEGTRLDSNTMERAIAAYQRGFEIEAEYATNHANLALLWWAQGEAGLGLEEMSLASERAHKVPEFNLSLGKMLEETGQEARARLAYQMALDIAPQWAESSFFRATALRQETVKSWQEANPSASLTRNPDLTSAWEAYSKSDFHQALDFFEENSAVNTPEAYLGQGLSYMALGDFVAARRALAIASFGASQDWTYVRILLAEMQLAQLENRCDQLILKGERLLSLFERSTVIGLGTLGLTDYGWYIYFHHGIAAQTLPGLETIQFTDPVVNEMKNLQVCYQELGMSDKASGLLERIPDLQGDAP